jgi:isoleucyl-tRNA synthetase
MDDVLISVAQVEGYETMTDRNLTVVLNTKLTPELLEEGFIRECVSKIQTMRKEAGFEVMDHITVSVKGNAKLEKLFADHEKEIAGEVLADEVRLDETIGYSKEWNINGESVTLGVEKR